MIFNKFKFLWALLYGFLIAFIYYIPPWDLYILLQHREISFYDFIRYPKTHLFFPCLVILILSSAYFYFRCEGLFPDPKKVNLKKRAVMWGIVFLVFLAMALGVGYAFKLF